VHSPSREKRLLASSCPPIYPRLSARLSLDVFSRNLILGTSMKIRLLSPDVAKIKQKFRALYVETCGKYVLLLPAALNNHETFFSQ
jgi:hypothetical protein